MNQEFTKIYDLPNNLYTLGAPVLIAAGALRRYNPTGQTLIQLKFRSLVAQRIATIKIAVTAYNQSGQPLGNVCEFEYSNWNLVSSKDAEFGDRQANFLPSSAAAAVQVRCTVVSFTNGTVWQEPTDACWEPLPEQIYLHKQLGNLTFQYQRDLGVKFKRGPYVPFEYKDLWLCACGKVNHQNDAYCFSCNCGKERLFSALDKDALAAHKAVFDMEAVRRSEENAARKRKELEEKNQRKRDAMRIATLAVGLLIVILLCVLLSSCSKEGKVAPQEDSDALASLFEGIESEREVEI